MQVDLMEIRSKSVMKQTRHIYIYNNINTNKTIFLQVWSEKSHPLFSEIL